LEGIAGSACATLKVAGTASAVGAESNASALVGEVPTRLGLDRPMRLATMRNATCRVPLVILAGVAVDHRRLGPGRRSMTATDMTFRDPVAVRRTAVAAVR
jgi:hypothetical protein